MKESSNTLPKSDIICDLATAADIEPLLKLYQDVQDYVAGSDNDPLWQIGVHPSRKDLEDAISEGGLLVLRDGEALAGAVIVNDERAQGYEDNPWKVQAPPDEVQIIHLFCIHPNYQGRGLARKLLESTYDVARARGAKAIRLDTLVENKRAQRTYEALGYDRICECNLFYPTLEAYKAINEQGFVLYELAL